MDKLAIIIPIHNEERTIRWSMVHIKQELNRRKYMYNIILVDDGSNDNTADEAIGLCDKVIRLGENQGKGAAFIAGLKFVPKDCEYVMLIDSDLQVRPRELSIFYKVMKLYEAEAVVGNKRHPYSTINYSMTRWLISEGYNLLCRALFGIRLRDTQCGLKLFRHEALDRISDKIIIKRFAFDLELLVALKENNMRIVDAPVCVFAQYGQGSASWQSIWQTGLDTLRVWIRKIQGKYKIKNGKKI